MIGKKIILEIVLPTVFLGLLVLGAYFGWKYFKAEQEAVLEESYVEPVIEEKSLGEELFDQAQNPAEDIPTANPFEAESNPFEENESNPFADTYVNPFE